MVQNLARIKAWLDPSAYSSEEGYQTLQSLYAIGSGGLLGKGIGESVQKLGFIPEAQNDMIFAIICVHFRQIRKLNNKDDKIQMLKELI